MNQTELLKGKIEALNNKFCVLAFSDMLSIIIETLSEQTGLKIKQEGKEIQKAEIVMQLKKLYEQELSEMKEPVKTIQIDLEDSISEIKSQKQ